MTAAQSIEKVKAPDDVWCPIFTPGYRGGRDWTEHDLRTMERNAKLLAGRLIVPITAGHPVLFGAHESAQPALGTVSDLRVQDEKLWARMSKVPAYAKQLARDGRYLSVSAEIVPDISRSPSGAGLEDTGAAGPAVVGLAWLGKHRGRVKDLPSLAALYNSEPGRDAGEDVDSITEPGRDAGEDIDSLAAWNEEPSETTSERLDAVERRFAELMRERSAMLARLEKLKERPAIFAAAQAPLGAPKDKMMTNQTKSFKTQIDDAIAANGGDVHDATLRLDTARQLIRDLQAAGEEVPDPQSYLDALGDGMKYTQSSYPGWGRTSPPKVMTRTGGGVEPGKPFALAEGAIAKHFAERLKPTPTRTSAEVFRLGNELAEQGEAPDYTNHAPRVAVVSRELSELVAAENARRNHHPAQLGEGWREATRRAMALSRQSREGILPTYGWAR